MAARTKEYYKYENIKWMLIGPNILRWKFPQIGSTVCTCFHIPVAVSWPNTCSASENERGSATSKGTGGFVSRILMKNDVILAAGTYLWTCLSRNKRTARKNRLLEDLHRKKVKVNKNHSQNGLKYTVEKFCWKFIVLMFSLIAYYCLSILYL